ncbi:MAG: hypothetical protein V2A58_07370 [Planctomycetota bacterium]
MESLLKNASFAGAYRAVAPGWTAEANGVWRYGLPRVLYTRETRRPHSGRACQRIDFLVKKGTGEAKLTSDPFPVRAGKAYRLRVWLRGKGVGPCSVSVGVEEGEMVSKYLDRLAAVAFEESARVEEDWRCFEAQGVAAENGEGKAFIRLTSLGTLWVDDAQLEEADHDEWTNAQVESPPDQPTGNLVQNSSFEAGTTGWGPFQVWSRGAAQVLETPAPHGRFALRFTPCEAAPRTLESWYFRAPRGRLAVSLYLRADQPGEIVKVRLVGGLGLRGSEEHRVGSAAVFQVGRGWKRFAFEADAPPSNVGAAALVVEPRTAGTIWIDAVQVQGGKLTPYRPKAEVEVGAELLNPFSVLLPGEEARIRVWGAVATERLTIKVYDYHDRLRLEQEVTLDSPSKVIALPPPAVGIFRAVVTARGNPNAAEVAFATVPQRRQSHGEIPFAATHGSAGPYSIEVAKRLGFGGWRTHDFAPGFNWRTIQPEEGRWEWQATDRDVELLVREGFHVVGTFFRPPAWAPDTGDPRSPGVAAKKGDTTALEEFVRRAVARYKGRIRHWEVWNEPSESRPMDPKDYVRLLEATCAAVKREDPAAVVIGGGGVNLNRLEWLREVCRLGGLEHMDALAYHGYGWDPTTPVGAQMGIAADPLDQGLAIRDILKEFGKTLPLWNTESGSMCTEFYRGTVLGNEVRELGLEAPWWEGANEAAKLVLAMKGHGFAYWGQYYIGYRDGGEASCVNANCHAQNLVDYRGAPRPAASAVAAALWLLDAVEPAGEARPADSIRLYAFEHPQGGMIGVGTYFVRGMKAQLSLPGVRRARVFDRMGEARTLETRGSALELEITDEVQYLLLEGTKRGEIREVLANAVVREAPPRELCDAYYLAGSTVPAEIAGMRFAGKQAIGALTAYRFTRGEEEAWALYAADRRFVCRAREIRVSHAVRILDARGEEVPVVGGKCVLADGAPYVALGDGLPGTLEDLGAYTETNAREAAHPFGF